MGEVAAEPRLGRACGGLRISAEKRARRVPGMTQYKFLPPILALALLTTASAATAQQTENPSARVVLVLDASGSMWGQIRGRAKIEIAREVIHELLDDWDPSVHLGLTAYGHRRKGDCADIESLLPPDSVDPARVRAAVDRLNPKGKTPLSDAVVQAARELRYTEEKAKADNIKACVDLAQDHG